jgi:chromosome segregation ATPase
MKTELDDLKTHLDLISAEAEELNQTVINVREEKIKLKTDKAALENAIEGSSLSVVKLQENIDIVRKELSIVKVEIEALKDNSKTRDKLLESLQEENAELRYNTDKLWNKRKLHHRRKLRKFHLLLILKSPKYLHYLQNLLE